LGSVLVIRDITRLSTLERELSKRHNFHNIIGKNHRMQEIYRLIEDISDFEATVLITGESGTGKELVARAIHYSGSRSFKPFVTVNCSALAENLLESELFGHVKGAFTGAIRDHIGRFQMAEGGTLLLDEIGDISPLIQLKLLRVLQEKSFERVGDGNTISVDVRVITCTHQDLKSKVKSGEFREDLYYRLNVLEIDLPPLRKRSDDLPLLTNHFIKGFEKKFKTKVDGISDQVINTMMNYNWPGNIRELENCLERAVILSRGEPIELKHLALEIKDSKQNTGALKNPEDEAKDIMKVLKQTGWNKAKASRVIGVSRKTLYKKLKKFNIPLTPENV
jgi:DNA-binding NtrC family response regulator